MSYDLATPGLTVGVVGAGAMGRGIAQVAAAAGFQVLLIDAVPETAQAAHDFCCRMLRRQAEKGRITRTDADAAVARLRVGPDLQVLSACDVVIEAVVEDLEAKRDLFARLDSIVAERCILASNTSSLSITAIAAACRRPERVAGAHFFNPVPLMKLVEVIDGERTEPDVGDALMAFAARLGHKAVRVRDTPLFLVNYAGRGYSTEALAILAEGVATPADIDRVMRDAAGFPMGPFELFDLTGLDISHPSLESSFRQYYAEPRLRPTPETRRRLDGGLLGRKSGRGFYRYVDDKRQDPPEPSLPAASPRRVWISRVDAAAQERVAQRLAAVGREVEIESGDSPSGDALCLVTPLGVDATTAIVDQGLDPARTVAVDTLLPLDKRVTLMATPVTNATARAEACGLFAATGAAVTLIADSPGFIAQRILAAVVNLGCEIAQQRVSTPAEIDEAVRIGRGYPQGPLALGNTLGAARILTVLEAMLRTTGDPRYRPSLWLRRRVLLGCSLTTPDLAR